MKRIPTVFLIISLFSMSYTQKIEDVGAGVIEFLLRNPQTANRMNQTQSVALEIIGDLFRVEGERKHKLEYASSGSNHITINTQDGNQAQFVETLSGEVFLLANGIIYPISQELINQAKIINDNSKIRYTEKQQKKLKGSYFKVFFEQNGRTLEPVNNEVKLFPSEFDIIIKAPVLTSIAINASYNQNTYTQAKKNIHIDYLIGFPIAGGLAEPPYNQLKNITVTDKAFNYWYYSDENDHRYTEFTKTGDTIVGKRKIQLIWERDVGIYKSVSEMNLPLYLVFISFNDGISWNIRNQIHREAVKINWNIN